jgi:23S rRNA pseudouridine1911/1915/1917 synthase
MAPTDPVDPTADAPSIDLRSRIPRSAHGTPLLEHLLQRFRYHDRDTWLRELAAGRLTVDGSLARPETRLVAGGELCYCKQHHEPRVDTDVQVVHDDADVLVVDKPAHLPVHADGPFVRHTLVHLLRTRLHAPQLQLVHRLDRETSGLMVVARRPDARGRLETQFRSGTVAKAYLAVVHGRVAADFAVDAPIGHHATSSIALRRSAAADARAPQPARTEFTVVHAGADRTLLRAVPRTGRTHQIRVHLEHAGHPLLGDKLYGRSDADYLAFVAHVKAGGDARQVPAGMPDRQLLHAVELGFHHPTSGAPLVFTSEPRRDFVAWQPDRPAADR